MNVRNKVNSVHLEVYIQKIKEYRVMVERLQEELSQCKKENESLIDDLRDSKTKVAVLEEKKAQLQIELQKEKKKHNKQTNSGKVGQLKGSPHSPQSNTISSGGHKIMKQLSYGGGSFALANKVSNPNNSLLVGH